MSAAPRVHGPPDRRVGIARRVDRKMVINALDSDDWAECPTLSAFDLLP